MELGLKGKVAFVAAASKGLGYASALGLAREGAKVGICSRTEAEIRAAAERIASETGAEVLHEPRFWPEYHDAYYGAFVRDPDGNNVEAVCHSPAT